MNFINAYAEYGAVGIIVFLFVMMIVNLMKSQKLQNEDLDEIRQSIAKTETKISNVQSVLLKMLDRWNRSDETRDRRHEKLVEEVNDLGDIMNRVEGSVSRINGKA